MYARRSLLLLSLPLLAFACSPIYKPPRGNAYVFDLPEPDRLKKLTDEGRKPPAERLAELQALPDSHGMYFVRATDLRDYPALELQATLALDSAWKWILLGRDYEEIQEWDSAAWAYRSAILVAPNLVGSRPEKEFILKTGFEGLASVGRGREQPRWAELMGLCAELSTAYLSSKQAWDDNSAFFASIQTLRQATENRKRAAASGQSSINRQMTGLALGQAVSILNGDYDSALGALTNAAGALSKVDQINTQQAQLESVQASTRVKIATEAAFLKRTADGDISSICPFGTVVGESFWRMVTSATDTTPYRKVLARFGQTHPEFAVLLARLDSVGTPVAVDAVLQEIAGALQAAEIGAVRAEFLPRSAPPPSRPAARPSPVVTPSAPAPSQAMAPAPKPPPEGGSNPAGLAWKTIPGLDFQMTRTEVTVAQYQLCVKAGACKEPDTGGSCNWGKLDRALHPVNCLSWHQASEFARWAGGRLPTEAEWVHAAAGGKESSYSGGDELGKVAWYEGNSLGSTHAVGEKSENGYGLWDMSGNVLEWTADSNGDQRVLRGGSWHTEALYVQLDRRFFNNPDYQDGNIGFRLVRKP